jgi:hypothetical protein
MSLAGNLIKKGPKGALDFGGNSALRGVMGDAAKGAIGGGLVPLVRNQLDRRAEIGTLRTFMKQHELPPAAPGPAGTEVGGKVAAVQAPQEGEDPHMQQAARGVAGRLVAGVGGGALGAVARHQATSGNAEDAATMWRLRQNASVPIHEAPHGINAYMAPSSTGLGRKMEDIALKQLGMEGTTIGPKGAVLLGKDTRAPSVLAHELGHADVQSSRLGRVVQNTPTRALGMTSGGIGYLSGGLSGLSDDPRVRTLGLAAPALAAAPMLASEGLASLKAVRHLRGAGASRGQMWNAAKTLIPAWGTYASHAGKGVANAAIAQGLAGAARSSLDE